VDEVAMSWSDELDPVSRGGDPPLEDQQLFLPDVFPDLPPAPDLGSPVQAAPVEPWDPGAHRAGELRPRPLPSSGREPPAAPTVAEAPAGEAGDAGNSAEARVSAEAVAPADGASEGEPPVGEAELLAAVHPGEEPRRRPSLALGRILAIVNQKGGVGKTTSTINLGAALAEEGARVLLVDFDPQGALSVGLGLNPNVLELTIYNLLLDSSVRFEEVVKSTRVEGMDLLPANIDLAGAEIMLVSEVAREQSLQRALVPVRNRYHYILIDCPPSLGLLTVNALTAADTVLIPLECEYFALRGMALLMNSIQKIQERINPSLQIEGILATMLDGRTIHGREVLSRVTDAFGDKLFKTIIHKTIKFAEAPVAGEPILTYAPNSGGAKEYRDLAREVMSR
jgi:chromosome partitioning protein